MVLGVEVTSFIFPSGLVDDGAVLQTAQIEHADATVLSAAHEYVNTVGAEADIVNLLVVGNQLCLGRQRRNIPNRAGGIDTGRDNQAR